MPRVQAPSAPGVRSRASIVREYFYAFIMAVAIALVIRAFVVEAYAIPSGSMEDTLAIGDHILVNKFIYGARIPFVGYRTPGIRTPQRGDVVVFQFPEDPSKDFIKRVIGIPGDQVRIVDKRVFVNGTLYANPHELHKRGDVYSKSAGPRDNLDTVTVPIDAYFVMGDNRDDSYDSRFWGFVTKDKMKGLAFIKYWSWDQKNWRIRWENIGRAID